MWGILGILLQALFGLGVGGGGLWPVGWSGIGLGGGGGGGFGSGGWIGCGDGGDLDYLQTRAPLGWRLLHIELRLGPGPT